jgi:uncharacterized protein
MRRFGRLVRGATFSGFEWDHEKRLRTIAERGIDFVRAVEVLDRPHLQRRSDRSGEIRFVAVAVVEMGEIMALVYTARGDICRVISARKAWNNERRAYLHAVAAAPDEGPD